MKPQFIIIAILIMIKVIGVASRVKAENYIPGYTCLGSTEFQINYCGKKNYWAFYKINSNYYACNTEAEFQLIGAFYSPTYRCGNSPKFVRI